MQILELEFYELQLFVCCIQNIQMDKYIGSDKIGRDKKS